MLLSVLTVDRLALADSPIHSVSSELQTPSSAAGSSGVLAWIPSGFSSEFDLGSAGLLVAGVAAAGMLLFRLLQRRGTASSRLAAPRAVVPPQAGKAVETAEAKYWTPLEQNTTVVEELDNVEEEAEVFLMLGRMDMAIGVLRHYIESHDGAEPHVWMALLDILHSEGLRGEFEKLAGEIKARFNVAQPTWEKANQHSNSLSALEHLPHLLSKIYKKWDRPDCLGYLRELLHNDREGGRSGFQQEVFRELLLLVSIQEIHHRQGG